MGNDAEENSLIAVRALSLPSPGFSPREIRPTRIRSFSLY